MSVSKKWVGVRSNVEEVLRRYRSRRCGTTSEIARAMGTTAQNVAHVLQSRISDREYRALKVLRYRASKTGNRNPMTGRLGKLHPNWKGVCVGKDGYLTILRGGRRQPLHRVVMADALGLRELPASFEVHHIDEDVTNCTLDNLALATPRGHRLLHFMYRKDNKTLQLRKSSLREAARFWT